MFKFPRNLVAALAVLVTILAAACSPSPGTPSVTTTPTTPPVNLIANPSMEAGSATRITNWTAASYGSLTTSFTVSTDAQAGSRAGRVDVTDYVSGDAKWVFDPVSITPNTTYVFSDYYKSTVKSQVLAVVTDNVGVTTYQWLSDLDPAPSWTQMKKSVTVPVNAATLTIYHLLFSNGSMAIDNASLTQAPKGQAMVSIEFDDGWRSAYTLGLPIVKSFGWTPTQYVITDPIQNPSNYGTDYMTSAMVKDWVAQGGQIGNHTVGHADLTTLTSAQVEAELANSQAVLKSVLGTAPKLFATPYCATNNSVTTLAKKYFAYQRNCATPFNTVGDWDPYNGGSLQVLATTTVAEIQAALAQAKANGSWLTLTFHEVGTPVDPTDTAYTVTTAQLTAMLQAVKDSGLPVYSTQAAFDKMNAVTGTT